MSTPQAKKGLAGVMGLWGVMEMLGMGDIVSHIVQNVLNPATLFATVMSTPAGGSLARDIMTHFGKIMTHMANPNTWLKKMKHVNIDKFMPFSQANLNWIERHAEAQDLEKGGAEDHFSV